MIELSYLLDEVGRGGVSFGGVGFGVGWGLIVLHDLQQYDNI